MYIDVAVQVPQQMDDLLLTYRVPTSMEAFIEVGTRVAVPFGKGNKLKDGFVVYKHNNKPPEITVKDVIHVIDSSSLLTPMQVELGVWIADYYITTPYIAMNAMLPARAKLEKEYHIYLKGDLENKPCDLSTKTLLSEIEEKNPFVLEKLEDYPNIGLLKIQGCVEVKEVFKAVKGKRTAKKYTTIVNRDEYKRLEEGLLKNAPKQKEILFDLVNNGPQFLKALVERYGQIHSSLNSLIEKGLVEKIEEDFSPNNIDVSVFEKKSTTTLNDDQYRVINAIKNEASKEDSRPILIQGVTGSGKTEVYIHAIKDMLSQNKSALLLVPEITLTAQLLGRLRGAFGSNVAVMHSKMSDSDRFHIWQECLLGNIRIVVGVRSAIFLPMKNLGIIIIDEEHEDTYKQSEPEPRYHTVDVAEKRIALEGGILVLGSATPSLKSLQKTEEGKYLHLFMLQRVLGQDMPNIEIIDMREQGYEKENTIISTKLAEELTELLKRKEQAILFLNKRGFSSFLMCPECSHVIRCENCDISMTYHKKRDLLRCHYCDRIEPIPSNCPNCGYDKLIAFGFGTEQVEFTLRKLFPEVKCARLDHDTTREKGVYLQILKEFSEGDIQVLIGTQMLAKGFDFPNVTLAAIINADMSLNRPDYKAAEKTFQIILQVAGRAGRGHQLGKVFIQTFSPDNYVLDTVKNYDYASFYEQELSLRAQLDYPPKSFLLRIIISSSDKSDVRYSAGKIKLFLHSLQKGSTTMLGPSAAPIERIRGRYRAQILLKDSNRNILKKYGHAILKSMVTLRKNEKTRILVDIDPENIL